MDSNKPIITKFTVEFYERETDKIFESENIFDLKEYIQFPDGAEINSLCIGNKFLFKDKMYLIKEFSIDILNAYSSSERDFNLLVSIFVDELVD